jgi:hypothetical protein
MLVKIGDRLYDSEKQPIMVVLSDEEKVSIGGMSNDSHKYCSFPEEISTEEIMDFMQIDGLKAGG